MQQSEIEELKKESTSLYSEACNTDLLIYLDLEAETNKAIIELFFETKTTKTDLVVLFKLINHWTEKTSEITFHQLVDLRCDLLNPQVSRSIKNLIDNGFISKTDLHNTHNYIFNIPLDLMRMYIASQ